MVCNIGELANAFIDGTDYYSEYWERQELMRQQLGLSEDESLTDMQDQESMWAKLTEGMELERISQ
jgi:hypothetical protein